MFGTTNNRNRKGRFTHKDREPLTAEQRQAHQQATADVMQRNSERPFDIHALAPTFAEMAAHEGAKALAAIHRGNAFNARLYTVEAIRLARKVA